MGADFFRDATRRPQTNIALVLASLIALTSMFGPRAPLAADYMSPSFTAWQRDDEGHLTITWAETARVQQQRTPDHLILRFAEPLRVDIRSTLRNLSNFIDLNQTITSGSALSLALKPGVAPKVKVRDDRIVTIDFFRDPAAQPSTKITAAAIDGGLRLSLDWPGATQIKTTEALNDLHLQIMPAWEIDIVRLAELEQGLSPWLSELRMTKQDDSTILSITLEPQTAASVRSDGTARTTIDLIRQAAAFPAPAAGPAGHVFLPQRRPGVSSTAAAAQGGTPPIPKQRPAQTAKPPAPDQAETAAAANTEPPPAALTFDWKEPAGAAVFVRAGHLWVVFDRPDSDLLSGIPEPPAELGTGSFAPSEGGTAFHFPLRQPTNFDVTSTAEGEWTITPVDSRESLQSPMIERTETSTGLRMASLAGRTIVRMVDPVVGDRIESLPLPDPGTGLPMRHRFVDVTLLQTAQGLAWRPLNDQLIASLDGPDLAFDAPKGLSLSTISTEEPVAPGPIILEAIAEKRPTTSEASQGSPARSSDKPSVPRIKQSEETVPPASYFRLAKSGVEPHLVNEYRRIRRQAISKAVPEKRNQARLNLVRLLVSERLLSEARTVLGMVSDDGDVDVSREKKALSGVTAFIDGRIGEASSLLLDPDLDNDEEIGIWRAALESADGDWQAAADHWRAVGDLLDAYPPRLKLDLGLMALEAAIETENDKMMRKSIRRLASLRLNPYDQARFDRIKALRAERSGNVEKAKDLLQRVIDSPSPVARTLADFELAVLDLDSSTIDFERRQALDRRMPLWRGHPQEPVMLDKLARRYREANAPREALTTWQRLTRLYPETADADDLKLARQETFAQALTGDSESFIDPLEVYAIYLDFIEHLPGEPEARDIHRRLARALTELDLLNEAIDVLQALAVSAPDDVERAQLAAEIAGLMLDLDRAASALSVLDASENPGVALTAALNEQRRLIRARALARLDRADEALRDLRDLTSSKAHRLQAEILWNERRWPRLAASTRSYLDRLDQSSLTEDDQKIVLWLALALQEEGTSKQLVDLRASYGEVMQDGPHAEAFEVATQGDGGASEIQALITETENQLAEFRRFRRSASALP